MCEVRAVKRDRVRAGRGSERRPRGQPEVRVDHVEAIAAVAAPQRARRRARRRAGSPGENANSSTSTSGIRRSASTWSRTKLPSAGRARDGIHVRDDQRAHWRGERTWRRPRAQLAEGPPRWRRRCLQPSTAMTAYPEQPVAVFDSGVGGLTVLHELLVSLPPEDYLYLGDTARFPYGARTPRSCGVRRRDRRAPGRRRRKLLVVACNSASAAALEALERHLDEPGARST